MPVIDLEFLVGKTGERLNLKIDGRFMHFSPDIAPAPGRGKIYRILGRKKGKSSPKEITSFFNLY